MTRFDTALFDFDGTLFDTSEGIVNAVKYSLEKMSVSDYTENILRFFIGPPLTDSYSRYFGFDDKKAIDAVMLFREYYSSKGNMQCDIYPGVREFISAVKAAGIRVGIATSKPEFFAKKIAERFGVDRLFECISGASLNSTTQNKAESIKGAIKSMNITDLNRCVMIGDRSHDIIGAKKTGLSSIGVLYGFGTRQEFEESGADYIAADFNELKSILLDDN